MSCKNKWEFRKYINVSFSGLTQDYVLQQDLVLAVLNLCVLLPDR